MPAELLAQPFSFDGVSVVESTADYVFGSFQNIALYSWRRETTHRSLQVAVQAADQAQAAGGGRHGLFGVAEETAIVPGSELRTGMSRLINARAGSLMASSFAFEGTGFRSATIRSVGIALSLLLRGAVPHRVFATQNGAVEWLCAELRSGGARCPDPREILEATQALRRCPIREPILRG